MASTTGIELGPNCGVLLRLRQTRGGTAEVQALHTIGPAEWPATNDGLTSALLSARRRNHLPRRAVVVAWSLPEGPLDDATARGALWPVSDAGFRIEAVLTPPQALVHVASARPRSLPTDAVAWLALNTHGAAIAIVRGSELLFGHTFSWQYDPDVTTGKPQLLQRYSLIAHLAPEVRHAIQAVRASHDVPVAAVVTCGNLPELRSLTMPLIEELDLEVETLDSADGLTAAGPVTSAQLADAAPAIRLAAAAALCLPLVAGGVARTKTSNKLRVAAAAVLIAALGWGGYSYWNTFTAAPARPLAAAPRSAAARPADPRQPSTAAVGKAESKPAPRAPVHQPVESKPALRPPVERVESKTATASPAGARGESKPAAAIPPPRIESKPASPPRPRVESKPLPVLPPATASSSSAPPVTATPHPSGSPPLSAKPYRSAPLTAAPARATEGATSTMMSVPPRTPESPTRQKATRSAGSAPGRPALKPAPGGRSPAVPRPSSTVNVEAEQKIAPPADTRRDVLPAPAARSRGTRIAPAAEPLPKIDSILIDQDRRLAIIDGSVVAIGDQVGARTVTQIDRDGVVLREPSGTAVRISLRPRIGR